MVAAFCAIVAVVLNSSPALASDPTGTFSGIYAFLFVIPWVALNLAVTVAIVIRGGYRSAASANLHAAVGAALPLIGFGVTAFDYFVVRQPSTPWPGIETILISTGLCILGAVVCLLAPLLIRHHMRRRSD
ncbi:hypothetical protein [Taklimakanibacter deserti]|uniref:hypothetical protein n=1 Tax=Taklimakanibacter deserti TaxID=2267839 RepID=UPI0013C4E84E